MSGIRITKLATILACLIIPACAETVQFFYNLEVDTCNWHDTSILANQNTANGGLCAYVSSIDRVYACPAPDASCWTFDQACTADSGNAPGPKQIQCDHGGTKWCCQAEETCTVIANQINVCISQFASPNIGVSKAAAVAAEFSAIPSASIPTTAVEATPSVIEASTFVVANAGTATTSSSSTSSTSSKTSSSLSSSTTSATSQTSSSGLPTQSPESTTSPTPSLSGGAIAGVVIGALIGTAMILGTIIFLVVHRRRTQRTQPMEDTPFIPASAYHEKQSSPLFEAAHSPHRVEMPVSNRREVKGGPLMSRYELQ